MAGSFNPSNANKRLYNGGSEWQDDITNLADYYSTFFREFDPVIGRFNGVDPLSEAFENWTTYHYSYNNPINFNDPNGDKASNKGGYAEGPNSFPEWYGPRMRDVVDQFMTYYSMEDWTWSAGGGGGSGSYADFKATFEFLGSPEWKEANDAANMSEFVYNGKNGDPNILTGGWRVSLLDVGQIDENYHGFLGQLFEKVENGKVVAYTYAFAGTQDRIDGLEDIASLYGNTRQFSQAFYNARRLSENLDKELSFTGHSLGGGLASLAALVTNKKAITFNALGLSDALENLYGTNGKNGNNIKAYIVKGEIVDRFQSNILLRGNSPLKRARGEIHLLSVSTYDIFTMPWERHRIGFVRYLLGQKK